MPVPAAEIRDRPNLEPPTRYQPHSSEVFSLESAVFELGERECSLGDEADSPGAEGDLQNVRPRAQGRTRRPRRSSSAQWSDAGPRARRYNDRRLPEAGGYRPPSEFETLYEAGDVDQPGPSDPTKRVSAEPGPAAGFGSGVIERCEET
jgi:hypothetical protein